MQDMRDKYDTYMLALEAEKEAWLKPLTELIEKIDGSYGEFFKRLDCAGQIRLKAPSDEVWLNARFVIL